LVYCPAEVRHPAFLRSSPRRPSGGVVVVEHIPAGPPDAYLQTLQRLGVPFRVVHPLDGEPLPDWREVDGILSMGGAMHALDDGAHPWLAAEREWIATAVRGGTPFWGVCLGAQLLAAALGAEVREGPEPEIGVVDITVHREAAATDPVFAGAPPTFHSLQWHRDTFELPEGATLLAGSARYPHQAFVWRRAYGVQFHLEPSLEVAHHWTGKSGYAPVASPLPADQLRSLLADLEVHSSEAMRLAASLFARWLRTYVGAPAAAAQMPSK
jgi:GMP synthase-like glutamine amidotransferase